MRKEEDNTSKAKPRVYQNGYTEVETRSCTHNLGETGREFGCSSCNRAVKEFRCALAKHDFCIIRPTKSTNSRQICTQCSDCDPELKDAR